MRYQAGLLAGLTLSILTGPMYAQVQADSPAAAEPPQYRAITPTLPDPHGQMGGTPVGVGWGTWCEFTAGPLAGQRKNFAPQQGPVGGTCTEGSSTGSIVSR